VAGERPVICPLKEMLPHLKIIKNAIKHFASIFVA
jgi:hypothetical protein